MARVKNHYVTIAWSEQVLQNGNRTVYLRIFSLWQVLFSFQAFTKHNVSSNLITLSSCVSFLYSDMCMAAIYNSNSVLFIYIITKLFKCYRRKCSVPCSVIVARE